MTEDVKMVRKRRPKGDGSVQKLANGRYKIQIDIGIDGKGNRTRKTFTGRTQAEAITKKNQYLVEKEKGTLIKSNTSKLSEFITRWLSIKEAQTKIKTYESYVSICDLHIIPTLGMHKVQKITTAQINDYIATKLKSGLTPATVLRHKAILHNMLDLAVREGIIIRNVVTHCNPIKKREREKRPLTPEETSKILAAARSIYEEDNGKGNRFYQLYHILRTALTTGMRRGEILALKWENIDTENNTITVKENVVEVKGGLRLESPKTEKSRRVVQVSSNLLKQLEELQSSSEFVFHTRDGNLLAPSNVCRAYRKLLKGLGIGGTSFHSLRHTNATRGREAGQDIKVISERLGHSNVATTIRIYNHTSTEEHRKAAEQLDAMFV